MTQTKATGHKELSPIEEIVLADGGTMAALMRTFDWETSPLGPVSEWPHSLHTVVSIALTSQFPIVIFWGPELRMFYNDAYLPMLADKHPASLGQAAQEVWPEIWSIIGPMLYEVLETGQATWSYDLLLPLVHHGAAQEHYFTFSYSPIRDESGNVCGVFCPVTETTARLQGERRERHLRAEAEAARDRVTHILESMREGHFVLDHEWRITSVNAAAARFTQRRQEELPGKNFWKEFPAVWSLVAGSEFRRAMTERVAVEVEDHYPPFDEWYEVRAYPLPDGGLSIFLRDITQRKRNEEVLRQTQDALERRVQERTAELVQVNETLRKEINERIQTEQQLQHSHERIRTILESITSGFYALDHQWRFTYVNAQAGPLIQRIPEELLGKSVWEEFPEAAESIVYQEYQRAVTEQVAVKFNIFYQSLQVCFEIHAYPSPDGLSVYFHDISERKRIEEKLHQSERLAVIGTTVAKLGHEIGNPLNGMFSTIQILERVLARQPSPDAMVVESVQDLKHEINRLRALLHELRTFVRPRELDLQLTNLAEVVTEVLRGQTTSYLEQNVSLEQRLPSDLPGVMADREKLAQVLLNLCNNAVEAMPQGGTLTVCVTVNENCVCLEVKDSGAGIPEGINVFEPFVTTKAQGTGLGLVIVKQLVEAHGGTVTYTSTPEQGTIFTLKLPTVSMQENQKSAVHA